MRESEKKVREKTSQQDIEMEQLAIILESLCTRNCNAQLYLRLVEDLLASGSVCNTSQFPHRTSGHEEWVHAVGHVSH